MVWEGARVHILQTSSFLQVLLFHLSECFIVMAETIPQTPIFEPFPTFNSTFFLLMRIDVIPLTQNIVLGIYIRGKVIK